MLIQELCAYANDRMALPPPMYQTQPIRYLIALRSDGTMVGPIRDTASPKDKELKRGIPLLAPHIKRAMGIRPKLLADNAAYVLGIVDDEKKAERAQQQHAQFVELVDQCRDTTDEPSVAAVSAFLANLDLDALPLPADFDPTGTITFEVGSELQRPIDLRSVRQFWAARNSASDDDDSSVLLPCIGCGQLRPALERHPLKIKGVPGGQILKDLVSANAGAFESYGLKASQIAPMCQSCAEAYGNALNALLADKATSIWMKEGAYAFWTREPSPFSVVSLITAPEDAQLQVRSLIESYYRGIDAAVDLDPNQFFAVGLGASGARLVVRDWLDTTVGEAQRRLGRYFALQDMIEWDGSPGGVVPLYRLSGATTRDPRKDAPPPVVSRSLVRLALGGVPLPMDLLFLAVRRNRAAQDVSRERAMLIKMVLCSRKEGEESIMAELDQTNVQPAYLCGRLLAVLDRIQGLAIKGANTGIVDKFYGSASSAPASVFGTLMHGAQAHMGKLKRDMPGAHHRLEEQLEAIALPLREFPKTLTLEEQGLFALGFYHQRAADRLAAKERSEARKTNANEGAATEA